MTHKWQGGVLRLTLDHPDQNDTVKVADCHMWKLRLRQTLLSQTSDKEQVAYHGGPCPLPHSQVQWPQISHFWLIVCLSRAGGDTEEQVASQRERAQAPHGSWVVAFPSCPYETEGCCSTDPLILNLLTSCRALKLLQDGYKVFVWMAFPFSGKTGRPYHSFYNFPYNFYESKQLASKSPGCNCPCDPNQVTEPSGWTHGFCSLNLART